MNRTLLILALHIVFLTSAFGQTLSDTITLKKVSGKYGLYQKDNKLSTEQLTKTLKSNPEALEQFKSAKSASTFGAIISGAGGFMIGWPLGTALAGGKPAWALAGVGAGLVAVSIPLARKADRKLKGAIKTYNDGLKKPLVPDGEMKISMSGNGVGLLLTF